MKQKYDILLDKNSFIIITTLVYFNTKKKQHTKQSK